MNEARQTVKKWQEDEALRRFQLISPLLEEGLDDAKKLQLREQIAKKSGVTTRTLYRYEKAWRENDFQGLKPQTREKHRRQDLPGNFEELLQQAILLRREVPKRSVAQIIAILELEHRVAPGVLKRSTLERHLYQAGYGRRHLEMYCEARESSSKRFCKPRTSSTESSSLSGRTGLSSRPTCPLRSTTIHATCYPPCSMTIKRR